MKHQLNEDKIVAEVQKSRKYAAISEQTIRRISREEMGKYKKEKEVVKSVKNRLHQISESFMAQNAFSKWQAASSDNRNVDNPRRDKECEGIQKEYLEVLKVHSSTAERLSFYVEMYDDIFAAVGAIESVLDLACGLNPIMLAKYNRLRGRKIRTYIAEDIHQDALDIVRQYYQDIENKITTKATDLLTTIPTVSVDMALLFKIVPLLEQQQKHYYATLINQLKARYIVVTFPTKTMSGKLVGMLDQYRNFFEEFIANSDFTILFTKNYSNELLYIIHKNSSK